VLSITTAIIIDNLNEPTIEYICEAESTPNTITFMWLAEDSRNNNRRVPVPDSLIETEGPESTELTLMRTGARFRNPSCMASNGFLNTTRDLEDFDLSKSLVHVTSDAFIAREFTARKTAFGFDRVNSSSIVWIKIETLRQKCVKIR